jgi:fibronectin type 3 domain-containing protein
MVLDKVNFDAYQEGAKIALSDPLQDLGTADAFGSVFGYAIRTLNKKKQDAGFSNMVLVRIYPVPNPPESIRFSFAEHFIKLSWQSPALNIDGSPVTANIKYNVYRATVPQARVRERLTSSAVSQNEFQDTTMILGQSYFYTVRASVDLAGGAVESVDSKEYEAKNVDTYPPRAPAELTAISDRNSISLVWLPNTEEDLAGYYVYRSGVERDFKRLTAQTITSASFTDRSIEKGKTYLYRVRALDKLGNESRDSEEVIETAE